MKSSSRTLKSIYKSIPALCLLMLFCILCTSSPVSAADTKAPAVVTVNGKAMEQAELDKQLNRIINSAKGQLPPEQINKIKSSMQQQIIEHFVTKTILGAECDKLKITVTDKELEDKLNDYKKRLPQGMTLEAALKQGGVDMKEMNDNIRFSLQVEKLVEFKTKDQPAPTEEEIKAYFTSNKQKLDTAEQVHARHILIKTDAKDDENIKKEKKTKINSIREQLTKGGDFAALAKENSDCPSGKTKGGDLGTFSRGRMVKSFEDAAFSQKKNDIGPVIETKFGYHIIQVLEKIEAITQSLDDSRDKIIKNLSRKGKSKVTGELIKKLRESAKIVYADAYKPVKK